MISGSGNQERIGPLEFIRGIAAIIVVLWHSSLAFYPELTGAFPNLDGGKSLSGTVFFALINGSASVTLFFVLSGYVLTHSLFKTGSPATIVRIAQRRIPRLAFLTTIVCVISWMMLSLGLYHNVEAGHLSGSTWLSGLGFITPPYLPYPLTLFDAVMQGAVWTFFRGDTYLNSSMWTMRVELIGSYLAICSALLIFNVASRTWRCLIVSAIAFYLAVSGNSQLICFLVGVVIADIQYSYRPKINDSISVIFIVFALYLYGYNGTTSETFAYIHGITFGIDHIYVLIISSFLIISVCIFNKRSSMALSGNVARFLGWISFPLYLVHLPIIFSVGSAVYIATSPAVAAVSTMVASAFAAIGLAMLNDRWMKILALLPLGGAGRLQIDQAGAGSIKTTRI